MPRAGIAGKDQANGRIALPQAAAACRNAFAGYRRQPIRTAGEIGRHIGRVLNRSRRVAIAFMTPQRRLPER